MGKLIQAMAMAAVADPEASAMDSALAGLASHAAGLEIEDVPEVVLDRAKLVVLDTLGVMFEGSRRPEVRSLQRRIATGGESTVFRQPPLRADRRTSALLNGIAARAIELCDGMRFVSSQPSAQIIPGLIAVAEADDLCGRDFLAGVIAGYEVTGRLASGFRSRPTAHQNGQAPLLGAVAAACRAKGFTAGQLHDGLNIAAHLLMAPSYHAAIEGATALNVPGGMSCLALTLVPELVAAGFTGQTGAVEEALSSLVGDGFDDTQVLSQLGERWELTRNYFRMHAACNPIHPALDALCEAVPAGTLHAEDIERIEFRTFRFAASMRNAEPANFFASKYSLPHAAATYIVRGGTSHRHLDDEALRLDAVRHLRHRIRVEEDASMSAAVPVDKPASVRVTLKDGRVLEAAVRSHRGDLASPYSEAALRAKYADLAGPVFPDSFRDIERLVDRLESLASIRQLVDVISKPVSAKP